METQEESVTTREVTAVIIGGFALLAAIIIMVMLSNYGLNKLNGFLTHHGVCSHGYESQCHPHKAKGH
jgi:hypothetical protein